MARNNFKIEGMEELQALIKELGNVPQKAVTPSAKKGMNVAFKAAKALAPVDEGELKGGLKIIGERSRIKGKKVYQVVFDRAKNDTFVKVSEGGKRAYYPASQEHGFFARNGRFIPGYHFLEKALTNNAHKLKQTIMDEMYKRIEKAMKG